MSKNNKKLYLKAEILGAFVGDGWIEKRGGALYIAGDPIEDRNYYDSFLGPSFSKVFGKVQIRNFYYWKVYGISCYKKEIINKCINYGFQVGSKSTVAILPEWVIKSDDINVKLAALRGIFDADGSFWCEKSRAKTSSGWKRTYHYHPEFKITSCSSNLLKQLKEILNKVGISSKVVLKNPSGRVRNRNVQACYALVIRKINHIKKYFKLIGSSNPRHQTRYAVWIKFGFLPPYTTIDQRIDILSGKLDPYSLYQ